MRKGHSLTVADTGLGMDKDTQRRAFEAFSPRKTSMGWALTSGSVETLCKGIGAAFHSGVNQLLARPGRSFRYSCRLPNWPFSRKQQSIASDLHASIPVGHCSLVLGKFAIQSSAHNAKRRLPFSYRSSRGNCAVPDRSNSALAGYH